MLSPLPLLLAASFLGVAHANCYHPNGTQTLDAFHNRCSDDPSSPIYNICCAIDRPNPPGGNVTGGNYSADICLPNGICQNKWVNEERSGISYFREECTVPDWNTGNCPNFCVQGADGKGNSEMTPCDGTPQSEKWCCGPDTSCCDTPGAIKITAKLGASSSSSSSASSPSSSASSTASSTSEPILGSSTSSPFPSPSDKAAPSTGLSGGAIAGIVIGAIAGVAGLIGAGFLIARRRKQTPSEPYKNMSELPGHHNANNQYHETYAHETAKYQMRQELSSEIPVCELENSQKPIAEVPTNP